jgi:predicted acylesterase/phospholipase RssA/proteasome lid subunit RPN8/RPN11
MTRMAGHRLAVEQLREVEWASGGALEVLHVREPLEGQHYARIEISISCGGMPRVEGGLPLRNRERFIIVLPDGFPFDVPSLWVSHTRFAGYPHVLWKCWLCLYQSPSTEWDSSDGMFGYIDRLMMWLRHGALNELQPTGQALHPPVTYQNSADTPLFIPRADTPEVGETPWIGLAKLRVASDRRIDINGWADLFAEGIEKPVAAAFLLAGQLPLEYPSTARELIDALVRNEVSRKQLLLTLAIAALGIREGDPLYVVVGAKMRGISGSRDLRQHLTVWRVQSKMADGLRSSLHRLTDTDELRELRDDMGRLISEWIEVVTVDWCGVREDRPEIVIRRDHDSPIAWFRGKTVALWGCGALGGAVGEALARAGAAKLILYDKAGVAPGLLARQPFDELDIGGSKAGALRRRLERIRPHDLIVEVRVTDLLDGPLEAQDWTDEADIVIDASASEAVIEKLELRRSVSGARRVPVLSMVIGPRAERGLVILSKVGYSGGPADLARRAKIEACNRAEFLHFADEFWPEETRHPIFQPEPGCSANTFVGSWADVTTLAMSMLNLVAQDLTKADSASGMAHFLAQGYVDITALSLRQASLHWDPDVVLEDPHAGYQIRVAPAAWREMAGWVERSRRCFGPGPETGGILFGERNDASRVIWVSEVLGPPPDSKATAELFLCGIEGVADSNKEKRVRTRKSVQFVGMWHTHPVSEPYPSETDFAGMARIVLGGEPSSPKPLLLITGYTARPKPWSAGAFVFTRSDFEQLREGHLRRPVIVRPVHDPLPRRAAPTIGLAMSGGGSRAIAFHLGCLRALHDLGLLSRVSIISAVSGGSVITGAYAYTGIEFAEFERQIVSLLRKGLARGIARRTLLSRNTPRALATLATAGVAALGTWSARFGLSLGTRLFRMRTPGRLHWTDRMRPPLHRRFNRTNALEATLRDMIYGGAKLRETRREGLDVVFNASELRTGTAFRFGSRESGGWRFGEIQENDVEVAHAVAASAAYPAFLPALDETLPFVRRDGTVHRDRVVLTDGGVVENLGVACLEPRRSDSVGYNTFSPDYIISCDAGAGQFEGHYIPFGWVSRMTQSFETVFRKAHDATLARLHTYVPTGQLKGFVLAYLGQQDRSLPAPPPDLVPREEVAFYPTDFSAMREEIIERISLRGEQLTRLLIARYCPEI